jgi:hypothetical protein
LGEGSFPLTLSPSWYGSLSESLPVFHTRRIDEAQFLTNEGVAAEEAEVAPLVRHRSIRRDGWLRAYRGSEN